MSYTVPDPKLIGTNRRIFRNKAFARRMIEQEFAKEKSCGLLGDVYSQSFYRTVGLFGR